MITPDFESFKKNYEYYERFCFYKELAGDLYTPIIMLMSNIYRDNIFLFESADLHKKFSRYSFFGYSPEVVYICKNDKVIKISGDFTTILKENPFDIIKDHILSKRTYYNANFGSFAGGLVGFIGYDMINSTGFLRKNIKNVEKNDPVLALMQIDNFFIADNHKGKLYKTFVFEKTGDLSGDYTRAIEILNISEENIIKSLPPQKRCISSKKAIKKDFDKKAYIEAVKALKDEIIRGEIIQAVLSNRYVMDADISAVDFYRLLRATNPSAYMFYLKFNGFTICGASPETHLKVVRNKALLKPIAGTYPKKGPVKEIKRSLLSDEKECSEHLMLLDLARNDISVYCEPFSVKVKKSFIPEFYSHVVHIVSEVEATLLKNTSPIDVFLATFPAGTVSGAPKVRAIELVDTFEVSPRGFYAGCCGYFSYNGNIDTAIIIRSAYFDEEKIVMRAGAGIVYDSDPEREFYEIEHKLKALVESIERLKEENVFIN